MFTALSMRTKISSLFCAISIVVIFTAGGMLWYSRQIEKTLLEMVNKEFVLYKTAQDMELALASQKGLLTYYLVDGDGKWLKSLGQYRQIFYQIIAQARKLELSPKQCQSIDIITEKYHAYIQAKDTAIENYQKETSLGNISNLHEKQRDVFFTVLELCRNFSKTQWQVIVNLEKASKQLSQNLRTVIYFSVAMFTLLCSLFLFILYRYILGPIRELAIVTGSSPQESSMDEVGSLTQSLRGMMEDFDQTSDELAKSRKHLLQAERMVMVGELAAGVAHTIRNPFTSIKMRMFSLGRSLTLNQTQSEDLQVISDEISRIDRIVENFLEFARPPKLKLKECQLSEIINSVLTLLEYRIKSFNVDLSYRCQPDLPKVRVDADRIKEAMVNLIINGCEAMEDGGKIVISEKLENHPELGEMIAVTIRDSGPGIPISILTKIVTPFYTTKEDGSGLGLSIVARIMQEHHGKLVVSPDSAEGGQCTILLPTGKINHESDPDNR